MFMGKKKPAVAILGAIATTVVVPLVKKAIDKKRSSKK